MKVGTIEIRQTPSTDLTKIEIVENVFDTRARTLFFISIHPTDSATMEERKEWPEKIINILKLLEANPNAVVITRRK